MRSVVFFASLLSILFFTARAELSVVEGEGHIKLPEAGDFDGDLEQVRQNGKWFGRTSSTCYEYLVPNEIRDGFLFVFLA